MSRAYLEICTKDIEKNIEIIKSYNPGATFCAVVKANAYGLGLESFVRYTKLLVDYYAVATETEAEIVKNICDNQVLLLSFPFENLQKMIQLGINFLVCNDEQLGIVLKEKYPNYFLKMDCGMNRLGFKTLPSIECKPKGIITHFHTNNRQVLERETQKYLDFCNFFDSELIMSAKATSTLRNASVKFDMIRMGICLYGIDENVCPIFKLKSKIVDIKRVKKGEYISYGNRFKAKKDMQIAIISCGYGDGFPRKLTNNHKVLICGKSVKLVGNICMDFCFADITNLDVKLFDEVVLIDNVAGEVEKIAKKCGTIPYEIMTNFSNRLDRIYV